MKTNSKSIYVMMFLLFFGLSTIWAQSYKIVDTGQEKYFNNFNEITQPESGAAFYGQDAQYNGYQPSYTDNGDGTITDNVTGLMWSASPDLNGDGEIKYEDKMGYEEAVETVGNVEIGGYTDWRIPTIKELYSLIMFYGLDPSGYDGTNTDELVPFINTDYFEFGFGDTDADERIIDAQFVTSTLYVGTTMNGAETMFGVNFADGRIKGYPIGAMPGGTEPKQFYVLYVRGGDNYGINDFADNGDGTITDNATGLMWQQNDSETGLNWEEALNWVQQKNNENYLGYNNWRLPNVKELQSIVDYTRAPAVTGTAAIDPVFICSIITDEGDETNYPFYWSGTTHENMMSGNQGAYVCFGEALGFMMDPFGNYQLMDVHGAGAQRSDPKEGDPDDYPVGFGPQGDVIRIYNYVRLVRDDGTQTSIGKNEESTAPDEFKLFQNYPNPFNPSTNIAYQLNTDSSVDLKVYSMLGEEINSLVSQNQSAGSYSVTWSGKDDNGEEVSSGIYIYRLETDNFVESKKMMLIR